MADADSITRLNAALEGRYRIERELGAGGMATVYLAEDVRHHRSVALKVLKPELAAVVGADRFLAEIETTANLQHPHILPLFDSGEADGFLFYVMPYLEGESLRARLDREHQLPVDEAVEIASRVASALDYAHRHGVIHRDIKPANILLHDGEPVVADFGIALAVSAGGGDRLTETGLSLGTPHYMSPEQATGDLNVGPQSDIWSLGCVLYEMLVGEPPFTGSTPQSVLGKIITGDVPAASDERKSVPPNVEATIAKALQKLPADRFATGAAFVEALGDSGFRYGERDHLDDVRERGSLASRLGWAVAVVLGGVLLWPSDSADDDVAEHLTIQLTNLSQNPELDIARDGSFIVYEGRDDDEGTTRLWIRRWALPNASPIPGTEGTGELLFPSISPSLDAVAFHHPSEHDLRVVDLGTGAVRVVSDRDPVGAPSWSPDGRWLYWPPLWPPGGSAELWRVPAVGGEEELILEGEELILQGGEAAARIDHPQVLPNGEVVMFTALDGIDLRYASHELVAMELGNGQLTRLGPGWGPRVSQEHLLFVSEGELVARPFDVAGLQLSGPAAKVTDGFFGWPTDDNRLPFAVSENGTLVHAGFQPTRHEFVLIDRTGAITPIESGWTFDAGDANAGWSLSPDGVRIAFREATDDGRDIWIREIDGSGAERLTLGRGHEAHPQWVDDETVAFIMSGTGEIWTKRIDGRGVAELLVEATEEEIFEFALHPTGDWLVVRTGSDGPSGSRDLYRVAVETGDVSLLPISSPDREAAPSFSPDGRWLAFSSNRTGRNEVWVTSFPEGDMQTLRQVSTSGGERPVWGPNGRELFFTQINGAPTEFMVAEIDTSAGLRIGTPRRLFDLPDGVMRHPRRDYYDVSPAGRRFLMARAVREDIEPTLVRIENFQAYLPDGSGR